MGLKNLFKKNVENKKNDKSQKDDLEINSDVSNVKNTDNNDNISANVTNPNDDMEDSTSVAYFSMVGNIENTPIYRLYKLYCNDKNIEIKSPYDFLENMFEEAGVDGIFLTSVEKKSFLYNCLTDLNKIYSEYEKEKEKTFEDFKVGIINNARKQAKEKGEDELTAEINATKDLINPFLSYDAIVKCFTTSDDMVAYCIVTPDISGGITLTRDIITKALTESKISTNIDEKKLDGIIDNTSYFKFIRIAKGTKAIDGKDGFIEDFFVRDKSIRLQENKQGQVDYKNLGKFSPIKKDDVICKIIRAIKGTPGVTVKGKSIKAYSGKDSVIPRGEGTVLSSDGLQLLANTDGYIIFENGKFVVKQKMFIDGNIDGSTGNIVFNGDVEVKGDIQSGFTVDVTGNIKVFGVVEGAVLKAGGDISLKGGVSGNNVGKLVAGGVIKSLFLENCEVRSQSGVFTESIIQSDVYSDTIVDCLRGKGAIIGGNVNAKDGVMANVVGSKSGKLTNINIGKSYSAASRQEKLEKQLEEEKNYYDKIVKNVNFLDGLPSIPENKISLYEQLKEQQIAYANKIEMDSKDLDDLIKSKTDYDKCLFKAGVVYEPVKLSIGLSSKNIPSGNAVCYRYSAEDGDIVLTPYR